MHPDDSPDRPSDELLQEQTGRPVLALEDAPAPAPVASGEVLPALKRPDITPAQIVAAIPVLAALLSSFGVFELSPAQSDALESAVTFAVALVGGDAIIRLGRSLGFGRRS